MRESNTLLKQEVTDGGQSPSPSAASSLALLAEDTGPRGSGFWHPSLDKGQHRVGTHLGWRHSRGDGPRPQVSWVAWHWLLLLPRRRHGRLAGVGHGRLAGVGPRGLLARGWHGLARHRGPWVWRI